MSIIIRFIISGFGSDILIYITTFFTARGFCLHAGHWPIPEQQTFRYPGFPSIFVAYKQTNDFYFSGHTGTCVMIIMIFYYEYKSKLYFYFGIALLMFTWYTLAITRVHYFNDLLIGLIVGIWITRLSFKYRFNIHYWLLFGYSKLLSVFDCSKKIDKADNLNSLL